MSEDNVSKILYNIQPHEEWVNDRVCLIIDRLYDYIKAEKPTDVFDSTAFCELVEELEVHYNEYNSR